MRHGAWVLILLGGLAASGSLGAAEPSRPGANRMAPCFRGDRRLEAKLDLAEKNRPVGEWLKALGERLKAPLKAGRATADDKITLFLKDRPAGEALTLILLANSRLR